MTRSRVGSCDHTTTVSAVAHALARTTEAEGVHRVSLSQAEAITRTSSNVASTSALWMSSGIPASGPIGRPTVREKTHTAIAPALSAIPASIAYRGTCRTIARAQPA